MESMKQRRSLAWLILTLVIGLLSLGFAGPAASFLPARGEAALAQLRSKGPQRLAKNRVSKLFLSGADMTQRGQVNRLAEQHHPRPCFVHNM
jgi:hypothetical protein